MKTIAATDPSSSSQPLLRFRKASQAVHATQVLDEVLARVIAELHSALDAEAASVALVDKKSGKAILHASGPVAERISGLELLPGRGIISWVIANGQTVIVDDVSTDARFWPDVDGYSGFETHSVLCAPLLAGHQVIGALEVLNKHHGDFTTEDLNFLEAFGAVAASAIESAQSFQQEQQRRREAEALRRAWEAFSAARSLEQLLDVILEQLAQLVEYRSAALLFVTEEGGLELGACRGIENVNRAAEVVGQIGIDVKVRTMLDTRRPLLIADTRTDARWRHFPVVAYVRSWIGAPLLIKERLIGTLNIDHDQPGFYDDDHVNVVTSFAHQAAIAIENSQLYAATHEATMQLAEHARRMVTLYETSRSLISGLELDQDALYELMSRITDLLGARYGVLNILAQDDHPPVFIAVEPPDGKALDLDDAALEYGLLKLLSSEREMVRSSELKEMAGTEHALPSVILDSFLAVAVHARGRLLGRLLLADKDDGRPFSDDDEALALALATNLASAIENASLYSNTQQRVRELTALYKISRTLTSMKETSDVFTHLAAQVARLLDAKRCAFFTYQDGVLRCQPPGFGLAPNIIPRLVFPVKEDDPLYTFIHSPDPLISNVGPRDPDLEPYWPLLVQLRIQRLLSCRIPIGEGQIGLLVVSDKQGGEEFSEQDRHLVSIIVHQVSNVLQRALLQSRQREQAQIQAALLQVSEAISSLIDLDELLQTVAQITHRLVGCDHCFIAAWDERHAAFVPRAQSGLDATMNETFLQTYLRPVDILFLDRVTATQEPILLTRQDIGETIPAWTQNLFGLEHSLVVPLVIQERVVGLIAAAYSRQGSPPGEREIALETGIARQAAVAIENANLYEDLELHAASLERAYRDLKELDTRKTQFIQNVSHELRTPFTLIKGYVELMLEEEMGALSNRQKAGLAIIAEKTKALGRLIDDIVVIQTIDATSLDLHEFDVSYVIHSALANLKAGAPDVCVQIDLPPDPALVRADSNLIERVLYLLLDNAVKFSPGSAEIALRARREGEMLRVEVEDHGIGISEETLPHIFDRFYQADGSTTRRYGGAGLGLAIVKQIITAHGGQVGGRSVKGQGSTIHFTLPLASPSDIPV